MTAPILSLRGVNKSFGPIDVLHDISLDLRAGEVLCLLGDNGAGKSTVIRLLSGVHQPSSGAIEMDGKPVKFASPREAADHGIATVHQFGGTFPLMSIGRSFFVGVEPTKGWGPFKITTAKRPTLLRSRRCSALASPGSPMATVWLVACQGASGNLWPSPAPYISARGC